MPLTANEKEFVCKLVYCRLMSATDDRTAEECITILKKLGCTYPGIR